MRSLGELVRHGLECHQYADDTILPILHRIWPHSYHQDGPVLGWGQFGSWMKNSWLKLKPSNREVALLCRSKHFVEFAATMQSLLVEVTHPKLVSSVHSLNIILDSLPPLGWIATMQYTGGWSFQLRKLRKLQLIQNAAAGVVEWGKGGSYWPHNGNLVGDPLHVNLYMSWWVRD